jgi:hypothetical protein
VEHSCSRCGAAVDNSSPFCPTCEAPQVRFVPREHEPGQEPPRFHPATVPPPPPVVVAGPSPLPIRPAAVPSHGTFLRAAIYAGAIGSLLSLVPKGFLVGLPLAGVLAVRFFRMRDPNAALRPKAGFSLGALTGVIAFGILVTVGTITLTASNGWGEARKQLLEKMQQIQAANPDPQARQMIEFLLTPAGILLGLLLMCAVFVLLAGLGGLISAAVQQRRPPR